MNAQRDAQKASAAGLGQVDFRLLGRLEALVGCEPVSLGAPKQRALLAQLLLRANEAVPVERLVDALWPEEPPASAHAIQVYVSKLRRALGADRIEPEALEAYETARQALLNELGLEPSPRLQELNAAIRRRDSSLRREPPELRARLHLPAQPNQFIGRDRPARRPRPRARAAARRAPRTRAALRTADARPVPRGPPGGSAGRVPTGARKADAGARPGAVTQPP